MGSFLVVVSDEEATQVPKVAAVFYEGRQTWFGVMALPSITADIVLADWIKFQNRRKVLGKIRVLQ
jgi:hypothetical protein